MPKVSSTEEKQDVVQDANEDASAPSVEEKEDVGEPESMLDAVVAAGKPDPEPEQSSSSEESGEDAESESEEGKNQQGDAPDEPAEDEGEEQVPFHKHPRWKEVQAQLKEAKEARVTPEQEAAFKFKTQFDDYMAEADLNPKEFNDGLTIMMAMKKDPQAALDSLMPYVEKLQIITGAKRPDDIQERVDSGLLDGDSAKELADSRNRIAMAERAAQEAAEAAATDLQNQAVAKASEWETNWKASDPDYAHKQGRVLDKINLSMMRHVQKESGPLTPAEVVKICETAKEEADAEIAALMPKPTPRTERCHSQSEN